MVTPLPWRFQARIFHGARCLLLLAVWLLAAGGALAQTTTIGSTTVPVVSPVLSSYFYGPIYRSSTTSTFDYSRYAHLYTPAELGVPTGAVITELAWLKSDAGTLTGNNVFNVLLANSTATTLATGTAWTALTTGATAVYSSTTQQVTGAAGTYFSVALNQPFVYTGGNLLVLLDHQKQGTASGAVNFVANPATGFAIGYADSAPITAALTTGSYGNFRPTLRITYAPASACTAPPTAGTTVASSTSICTGNSVSLSLQGATFGTGLTYQWQQSTDGVTYTDITGATGFTYTTPVLTATRYYRARLTCSGQSATSTPAQVTVVQVAYATLPVIQSFENTWLDVCNSHDAPNTNWRTNPSSGNSSWRRDDDGATANWTSPTVGVYTPAASQGSRSARFHSYYAGAAATGSLDVYVNLSTAGGKGLAFDYINTAGNDSLLVSVSNDGGVTFGAPVLRLGQSGTVAQGFRPQSVTLTGTSATAVVRFTGKVTATFTSDIGIDNVRIESVNSCLAPLALAVTGTTSTSAVVSWASAGTGASGYTVFYGPAGFTPGGTGSQQLTATGTTATIPGLTPSTEYQFYVRQTCGTSFSGNAGPVTFRTDCLTPLYATLPVVESFENTWISRCDTREVPSNNWRNTPATGNNSWRRDDDGVGGAWVSPTSWGYTPTGSVGTRSARFHSGQASSGQVGTLDLFVNLSQAGAKQLSFDYINTTGNDSLTIHLSTDGGITFGPALLRRGIVAATGYTTQTLLLNSTSATAVLRFRARADFGTTDIGLDNIRLESAAGCTTPINLTTTSTTANSALVAWQGTNTGTYTVFYGAPGFTPGGTGSQQVTGITGNTATIPGLAASTEYEFYVRQDCGGTSSGNAGPVTFRTACLTPIYATLPVIESFENTWISRCDTREVPTNNWRNTPATGNNSWRREDDGVAGAWVSPTSWGYTPTGSTGTHSARFHSGQASSGQVGTFDLFVNLSQAGAKQLSFDFINTSGSDSLTVHLSTDGGLTFGPALLRLNQSGTTTAGFSQQALILNSTSATAVIRFRGRADFGVTDIGLDNIRLESALGCLTPVNLAVTATTTTSATVTWQGTGTGTYSIQYGPAGFTPGNGTTVPNVTSPYTITGLTAGTQYQFYVSQNCGGTQSGLAGPINFNTRIINDEPCGAISLTLGSDCTVPVQTTNDGATTTTPNGYTNGGTGNCGPSGLTSPKDVWFKFRTNAANRGATEVTLTVTGAPANVVRVFSGSLCSGALVPVANGCAASVSATSPAPVLALTGLTPSTDYYVQVSGYTNTATLGNFTMCAVAPSTCPVPVGPAATTLTATSATLSWSVTSTTPSGTYTIEYGAPGFTVGAGVRVQGITGTSATITGLTADTQYCFYVRQECNAASGVSAFTGPTCFRTALGPAANDEPCNAIVLTAGATATNATNLGATTTTPAGYQNPGCSTAGAPKDVWFRFVATATTAQVRVTGNPAGQVRLFSAGACAGPFTQIACQAGTGANTSAGSLNASGLTIGTTYYVSVSGYSSSDFTGAFTVQLLTVLSSGTGTLAQGEVNLYPNPSHDGTLNLAIRGAGNVGTVQAVLFNSLGQQVFTQAVAVQGGNADKALPVQNLAKGLYTLRMQVGQTIITRKVVLE
ncbi:fibronectin type III domain-containing protein [Hymenobacter sp. BT186]|uniref:Fibronectin type III domain-containing protein n=1 Tax=Hymenobacter telluris TaxID=2816474 RepID=A0A939ETA8_9BACT|nr:fibronectin type III domain-containing protein [Hymenobacter telluris]MBO0357063.1 fibronectin type III domain-containing protein [Hymenobacter telluris]MBW3373090.1 fibronectin type III domain-containing protein [Hymenobacter norwichensis]